MTLTDSGKVEIGDGVLAIGNPFAGRTAAICLRSDFSYEAGRLFLDEATSALDESSEAQLYYLLRTASWRPTIVSVGHRGTLRSFHDQL